MSSAAHKLVSGMRIRVAVQAADPQRGRVLSKMLAEAGYLVTDTDAAADVVLADGDCASTGQRPAIVLGAGDRDANGLLPANADVTEIDAAIRAVAAGLIVRSPLANDVGFDQLRESDVQALLTAREL